jgi:hypothetical protein
MYRAPESSESESEPSDKEVDQQLEDSSDQVSESVLSPLTGLSLIAQGKSKELDPGPSKPHRKPDLLTKNLKTQKNQRNLTNQKKILRNHLNLVTQDH